MFAFLLLAMLLGAMNYSNSLAFALTFLLGGMGMVTMHHTNSNLLKLFVGVKPVPAVFAGEPVWVPVIYHHSGSQPRYSLLCGLKRAHLSPDSACDCPADEQAESGFEIAPQKRGIYYLPRFAVACEFPLGLFQAWSWLTIKSEFLVYPQPTKSTRPIPPVSSDQGQRSGSKDGRDDFSHLRDYREGDSMRSIHWKRYGHSGRLSVKAFSEPMDESLWLDWHSLNDLRDHEARLSQLCRWVLDSEAGKRPYGLRLPGLEIRPARGPQHSRHCLEQLARFGRKVEACV